MNEKRESDQKMVQGHVNQLMEHWDSVQIFVTRHEQGESQGTVNLNLGAGNFFSRSGQIQAWLNKGDEYDRIEVRKENSAESE